MNYYKQFLMFFSILLVVGVLTAFGQNRDAAVGDTQIIDMSAGWNMEGRGPVIHLDGNRPDAVWGTGYNEFTPVSGSVHRPGMVRTVYDAGESGVRIAQTVYYQNGAYHKITWVIVNNGPGIYRNLRFKYGLPSNREKRPGLLYLPYKSDGSTGMDALEWNRSILAPGDKWTVTAFERRITEGAVDVFAPEGRAGKPGETLSFEFKIANFQGNPDTFELEAVTSRGNPAVLPGGNVLTLDAASGGSVRVDVTIPGGAGGGDELTLTAVSRSNPGIENSGAVVEIANALDSGSITVTSPNGGELIDIGVPMEITWTAQGVGNLKITLWQNENWVGVIADNISPSPGSFTWNVGEFLNGGNDFDIGPFGVSSGYTIKIKEIGEVCSDLSDLWFSMYWAPPLLILEPNGGESAALGSTMSIGWVTGVSGGLKVSLWKDGVKVGNIECDIQAGTDSCDWTVGELEGGTPVLPGTGYKIKIKEIGESVCDYSDAPFTITN